MKNLIKILSVTSFLCIVLSLTGCSQKFEAVRDTISLAFWGNEDIVLPADKVDNLPYASLYAKTAQGSQAFLVLGYAIPSTSNSAPDPRNVTLKWLSATNEMIVTEHGRIIKTVNLNGSNLLASYSYQADPLALGLLNDETNTTWTRAIDWQPGNHSGFIVESRFERQGMRTLIVNGKSVHALHFLEYVYMPELDMSFTNAFWLHPETGNVIASVQTLAPGMPSIALTILKPYSGTTPQ
ncbi:YjbF family lipoprotein [Grimontia hollisae]|uniref:YjbF family lipoprotein n=1 Tax=Grimontia hollisae TaxID=673 RepID=UPI00130399D7|nr:YjbF family lipoprotein [Grimontia hollisae]MDF2184447.1 YjbF family lipoprotein [Grimontia hollisae]